MYLKLIDEQGTAKLVNLSNAQSIEKFYDVEETNKLFRSGITIIWHDQILKDTESDEKLEQTSDYYYSEQVFFGISFEALEKIMIGNKILVPPLNQLGEKYKDTPASTNGKSKAPAAEVTTHKVENNEVELEAVTISDIVEPEVIATMAQSPAIPTIGSSEPYNEALDEALNPDFKKPAKVSKPAKAKTKRKKTTAVKKTTKKS